MDQQKIKECRRCLAEKPADEFNKNTRRSDGLQTYCKSCLKAYRDANKEAVAATNRAYREENADRIKARKNAWYAVNKEVHLTKTNARHRANREKELPQMAQYRANNPEKIKELRKVAYWQDRELNIQKATAWALANLAHRKVYRQRYRQENLEKIRASDRRYTKENHTRLCFVYKANKAKRRAAGKMLGAGDIKSLLAQQKNRCAICRIVLRKGFHLDHVMPIALGGTNEKTNFQCLCRACNLSKSKKHPIDFMQERGFLL